MVPAGPAPSRGAQDQGSENEHMDLGSSDGNVLPEGKILMNNEQTDKQEERSLAA